jgi:SNF2 family DNA or RNA helicase
VLEPSWSGRVLSETEAGSAAELGYFIRDGRLLFLGDGAREELCTTRDNARLAVLLPLMRRLRTEGRLLGTVPEPVRQLGAGGAAGRRGGPAFVRELYPYQKDGVNWLTFCVRHGIGTILADDMGLGKTAQLIATICDMFAQDSEGTVLIVVPNPLLDNWCREFSFFAPAIRPYVHHGPRRSGLSADLARQQVVITPYTTMASDISMLSEIRFRLAIFDEASLVKNARSGRTVAAFSVNADARIAATGTPVENSLTDAWTITELVFPGYLESLDDFTRRYIGRDIGDTLKRDLTELEENLRQITLRRMKKDVLQQLPPRRDIHLAVTMHAAEREAYSDIITRLRSEAGSGGANMLALISMLQQFTSHPALLDSGADTSLAGLGAASAKFGLLLGLLDRIRAAGEKVLVFATFQKMIDLLAGAVAGRHGITAGVIDGRTPNAERQPLIDRFTAESGYAVLLLHPRTAGMGLNITAATHVIHYSRQWNPALEMQATARAWRNGQTGNVTAYYLYYADSIEETVDERLRQKQELSDAVVALADDKESDKQLVLEYLEKGTR